MAVDGAGNTTERELGHFLVEKSGRVVSAEDQSPLKNAQVSLYLFEVTSQSWVLWDGSSFGQKNPQQTNEDGAYNFIAPPGRYYLEVKASNFRTMQSEIFDLAKTATLSASFPLLPKPKIVLKLPILGELNLVIPLPYLTQTLSKNELWRESPTSLPSEFGLKKGADLPAFSLLNPEGKIIKSSDYQGRSLMLTFLSIWASSSTEQALILNEIRPLLNEKQAALAIFLQDSPGEVETFMKRGYYDFDAVIDKKGVTTADYQISTLPQHVFIDSKGAVYETFIGVLNQEELLEKLKLLD